MFADYQTPSAIKATEVLFDQALDQVPITDPADIQREYRGFVNAWGSRELIKGEASLLRERVLSNLTRTAALPGFHYFTVHVRPQMRLAQVIAWSDGEGASACLWRSDADLYLCGNRFFE